MKKEGSKVRLITGYFQAIPFFSTLFYGKQFKSKQRCMLYPLLPLSIP